MGVTLTGFGFLILLPRPSGMIGTAPLTLVDALTEAGATLPPLPIDLWP